MSISVNCQECGRRLKAPDSAAGKRAKCPTCGAVVVVPEPIYDADEIMDEDFQHSESSAVPDSGAEAKSDTYSLQNTDLDEFDNSALPNRRPCPMCGEMIVAEALKCRFCGEDFTEPAEKKAKRDRSPTGGELTGFDWALCVLCSGIGCIVGIVALVTGDTERGAKMVGIALGFSVLWTVLQFLIQILTTSPW